MKKNTILLKFKTNSLINFVKFILGFGFIFIIFITSLVMMKLYTAISIIVVPLMFITYLHYFKVTYQVDIPFNHGFINVSLSGNMLKMVYITIKDNKGNTVHKYNTRKFPYTWESTTDCFSVKIIPAGKEDVPKCEFTYNSNK